MRRREALGRHVLRLSGTLAHWRLGALALGSSMMIPGLAALMILSSLSGTPPTAEAHPVEVEVAEGLLAGSAGHGIARDLNVPYA
ncbi:MAG: hypothetical protein ACK45V_03100, partial [Brevundimonas sp.]